MTTPSRKSSSATTRARGAQMELNQCPCPFASLAVREPDASHSLVRVTRHRRTTGEVVRTLIVRNQDKDAAAKGRRASKKTKQVTLQAGGETSGAVSEADSWGVAVERTSDGGRGGGGVSGQSALERPSLIHRIRDSLFGRDARFPSMIVAGSTIVAGGTLASSASVETVATDRDTDYITNLDDAHHGGPQAQWPYGGGGDLRETSAVRIQSRVRGHRERLLAQQRAANERDSAARQRAVNANLDLTGLVVPTRSDSRASAVLDEDSMILVEAGHGNLATRAGAGIGVDAAANRRPLGDSSRPPESTAAGQYSVVVPVRPPPADDAPLLIGPVEACLRGTFQIDTNRI